MSKKRANLSLFDQLHQDDWAIIIGSNGNLKGIFIPEGKDEDEVPASITYIMENYFEITPSNDKDDKEDNDRIIH